MFYSVLNITVILVYYQDDCIQTRMHCVPPSNFNVLLLVCVCVCLACSYGQMLMYNCRSADSDGDHQSGFLLVTWLLSQPNQLMLLPSLFDLCIVCIVCIVRVCMCSVCIVHCSNKILNHQSRCLVTTWLLSQLPLVNVSAMLVCLIPAGL